MKGFDRFLLTTLIFTLTGFATFAQKLSPVTPAPPKMPPVPSTWSRACGAGGACFNWGITTWWLYNVAKYPDQAPIFKEMVDITDLMESEGGRRRGNREAMEELKGFYELNSFLPVEADLGEYQSFERYLEALANATLNEYWKMKAALRRALGEISKMPEGPERQGAINRMKEIVDYQLRLVERLLRGEGISRPEMEAVVSGAEEKAQRRVAFIMANRFGGETTDQALRRIRTDIARRKPLVTRPGDMQMAEEMMQFINLEISEILK